MRLLRILVPACAIAAMAAVSILLFRRTGEPVGLVGTEGRTSEALASSAEAGAVETAKSPGATHEEATIVDLSVDGPSFGPEPAPADPLVIRGRVIAADSGHPIVDAEVSADRRFEASARTDADGRYTLTLATTNSYELRVEARAPGFGRREHPIAEFSGCELTVDFELVLARRASGRLVDATGAPIPDAEVSAHAAIEGTEGHMIDQVKTSSKNDGAFLLSDLRPDLPHMLRIRKPGFTTLLYCFPPDEKALNEVDFGEVELGPALSIEVSSVDDAGTPIPAVELTLQGSNSDWMRFTSVATLYTASDLWRTRGVSDGSGRFAFADLAPGNYQLEAFLRGHPDRLSVDVAVLPNQPLTPITVTFPRGLSIAGQFLDATGHPVAGASLFVAPIVEERSFIIWMHTDARGRFRAGGLEPGDYHVYQEGFWFDAFDDRSPSGPCAAMTVAAGSEEVVIRQQPSRARTIRGIVRDAKGGAVAFASVKVLVDNGGLLSTSTSVGGRFAVEVPREASARLLAVEQGYWPRMDGEGFDRAGAVTVAATNNEVTLIYQEPIEDK